MYLRLLSRSVDAVGGQVRGAAIIQGLGHQELGSLSRVTSHLLTRPPPHTELGGRAEQRPVSAAAAHPRGPHPCVQPLERSLCRPGDWAVDELDGNAGPTRFRVLIWPFIGSFQVGLTLQLLPMMLGFFTYKIAGEQLYV